MSNNMKNKKQFILIAVVALMCVALMAVAVSCSPSDKTKESSEGGSEAVSTPPATDGTDEPTDGTDEPTDGTDEPTDSTEPIENAPVQNDNVADDIFAP